jgi:acyl carrier protein
MSSPLLEKVRTIAADVLQTPASQITPQSSTENIEAWDSVHHLNLILAFEQEFGIQFEPQEIDRMIGVKQIVEVLESKLSRRSQPSP